MKTTINTILEKKLSGISAPQRNFLVVLFSTILLLRGKLNFRNLSRYSDYCEKTYSRQFGREFDFSAFNHHAIQSISWDVAPVCAALDASFIPKSGKHTFGKDTFFNSACNKPEKGLEISALAVIDNEVNTAFTISALQTPPLTEIKATLKDDAASDEDDISRIDFYLHHIRRDRQWLPSSVRYLLTDGYYSKKKFTNGILALNLHQIGKLRSDANLRYLYNGPQKKGRGRKKTYDGKVDFNDLSKMDYAGEVEPNIHLYTAVVHSPNLGRKLRIAVLVNKTHPHKSRYAILFSTDTDIDPRLIYTYYRSRFQIEFVFRDAKQFTGLCDCQAREQKKLHFHFNASLTALNLAKIEARNERDPDKPFVFSMRSIKARNFNLHMVDTIISILGLDPDLLKNKPGFQEFLAYGMIRP